MHRGSRSDLSRSMVATKADFHKVNYAVPTARCFGLYYPLESWRYPYRRSKRTDQTATWHSAPFYRLAFSIPDNHGIEELNRISLSCEWNQGVFLIHWQSADRGPMAGA
jgi:hypothetical protein